MRLFRNIIQVTKLDYFGVSYETSIEEPTQTSTKKELWDAWREMRSANEKYMNEHVYNRKGTQSLPISKIELYHEIEILKSSK